MPYFPPRPGRNPDGPEKKSGFPADRVRRGIVFFVCLALVSYGLIRLIGYGADLISARRTSHDLKEVMEQTGVPEVTAVPETDKPETAATASVSGAPSTPAPAESLSVSSGLPVVEYPGGLKLSSKILQLRKKSEYIIGWLSMDGLDEPVAFRDNEFFLSHDAMGQRNANGAVFMDEDTNLLTRPYTILLYGHNMKSGAMFGSLHKYEDYAYLHQHRVFRFDTLYEEGQYAAFSVAVISLTPGTGRYFSLADLLSADRQTRKRAIASLGSLSVHQVILDVNEEDQILLLITCVGDDDERLILAARRLRENETKDSLTLKK